MLGLTLQGINIVVLTTGGEFSVKIPFKKGLNIIRAENSSGKSTCINAIAYGLGLEAILGPSRKRPFPKSLYEEIYRSKDENTPNLVLSSYVEISVENSKQENARIKRDIQGEASRVVVIDGDGVSLDYFLGSSGNVGSANSEKGFHHWLANFIGWNLPMVVKFDGKECPLYLECIFPLFFIEQKRGWSEIQANSPSHYQIKNTKKVAAEFCLDINSFEKDRKIAQLKSAIENSVYEWDKIRSATEAIADYHAVSVNSLADISAEDNLHFIRFLYQENNTKLSVDKKIVSIKKIINDLELDVASKTPTNEEVDIALSMIRKINDDIEDIDKRNEFTLFSLRDATKKVASIKRDYSKYQQLKRLRAVGGDVESLVSTELCPVCDSAMYDTLGKASSVSQPMSLDENIAFLKNQLDFYKSAMERLEENSLYLSSKKKELSVLLSTWNSKLVLLKKDLSSIDGEVRSIIRDKVRAEIDLDNILKLKNNEIDVNERIVRVRRDWKISADALKVLNKKESDSDRLNKIKMFEVVLREYLSSFKFKQNMINLVSISSQTLRPEQDGYDIVAETSASDYIRIIWAYTLGLLELAGKNEDIKHGGFVVFDEPRQHEASKISFTNLIDKASLSLNYSGQVIFATSQDEVELRSACENKIVNLISFDDYVLQLTKKPESILEK